MAFAFLPYEGATWLCQANGPDVIPLTPAPGDGDAVRRFSTDGSEFGFLDQAGKRLGHYRLIDHDPWFETLTPPITLPPHCFAQDFVIHDSVMIAGGHGNKAEALRAHPIGKVLPWRSIPLPEGVGKRGKSIDALFVRGNKLIAIDNVLLPKWVLVYELEPELTNEGVEMVRLATHTTYEKTKMAVEGRDFYAVYSTGVNHGIVSHHVALLDKHSLMQKAVWSGAIPRTTKELLRKDYHDLLFPDSDELVTEDEISPQDVIDATLKLWKLETERFRGRIGGMLAEITDMVFCGDQLVLAVGNLGVKVADVLQGARPKAQKKGIKQGSNFRPISLNKIKFSMSFQCLAEGPVGFYVIGKDDLENLTYEWVPN